jgi:hypothetical protein
MKHTLVACLLAAAAAARAEDARVIEVEGRALLAGGEVAGAPERARDDALRACVQQVAASVATAASEADQVQLLAERIYARAQAYVRRFSAVDDRKEGDAWVTRLRCEVAEAKLGDDLMASGIAYRREGMPRIVVLVAEQGVSATEATGWWQAGGHASDLRVAERAFVDRMERSGFGLVDPEAPSSQPKLATIGAVPSLEDAREIGKLTGADVVVVGRAVAKPLGSTEVGGGTFWAAVANVAARAVRTDTGLVIAAAELTGRTGRGFDQATAGRDALSEAGRQLAGELFARIGSAWARERSGARRIAMAVHGVDDYARLAAFKAALASHVRGVKDVQERSMEDGRAELEVVLAGTAQAFAADLATRKLPGFTVKVRQVTPSAVEIDVR